MLPLADTPLAGLDGLCLEDFWQLPVSKEDFDQPEYYFGQTVWHVMKVRQGEILHPVKVVGAWWNGMNWEYIVELPQTHPRFHEEIRELLEISFWELEAM